MTKDYKPTIDAYLAAYREANPGRKEPRITVERGWLLVGDGLLLDRVRASKLDEWTRRLQQRVSPPLNRSQ